MEKFLKISNRSPTLDSWLDNYDLRPVEKKNRRWGFWTYSIFWISSAATLSNWYSPASFMSLGLTMWEALACHVGGQFLAGVHMVFSGRPGAVYHIGFPVLSRSSFGLIGALWPIINRACMSIIWNGINMVQGGQCIYVMLHAIFPSIAKLKNILDKGDALNSGGFIGFWIFWLLVTLCSYISIPKLRIFLHIKIFIFFASAIAMLVWTLNLAGGTGDIGKTTTKVHGSKKAWLIVRFTFLSWANNSTFIVNAADLQRYVNKPNNVILGQILGFPLGNFIVSLVGLTVASTSVTLYGYVIWNPVIFLDTIMVSNYTSANRVGAFFIALLFAYSALFSCIFENIIPAGNDLMGLVPKYLNITRAFLLCNILSVCCVPWRLLASSVNFLSWLSAYQVFLSAIVGIIMADYFLISKGYLAIGPHLFVRSKDSYYWFYHGFNLRAFLAYIFGIAPNFYGFLGNVGLNITLAAHKFYYFAFPVGFLVSFFTYWGLCWMYPVNSAKKSWSEPTDDNTDNNFLIFLPGKLSPESNETLT